MAPLVRPRRPARHTLSSSIIRYLSFSIRYVVQTVSSSLSTVPSGSIRCPPSLNLHSHPETLWGFFNLPTPSHLLRTYVPYKFGGVNVRQGFVRIQSEGGVGTKRGSPEQHSK